MVVALLSLILCKQFNIRVEQLIVSIGKVTTPNEDEDTNIVVVLPEEMAPDCLAN